VRHISFYTIVFLLIAGCGDGTGNEQDTTEETDISEVGEVDTTEDPVVEDVAEEEAPCTSDEDCDDSDPCTADTCDTEWGACEHEAVDADADGFPAAEVGGTTCEGTDCDDSDENVYPDSDARDCDGGDFNCNGIADTDDDDDGYVNDACTGGDDCDDDDATAFPGSTAVDCSTLDHDCNGNADEDNDGDTYTSGMTGRDCSGTDCDDEDATVYPGATEAPCDGKDTNCDGTMDGTEDADNDGFANATCAASGAEVDCDDSNDEVYPGAPELCDGIDNDCDGSWADGGADDDGDTVLDETCGGTDCDDTDATVYGGATEICVDGIDQDCDTLVDGPIWLSSSTRVSGNAIATYTSSIAWGGSQWGIAWEDNRLLDFEIYFARVDPAGTVLGSEVRITDVAADCQTPSMAWTGSEFALTWRDGRDGAMDVYFARIAPDGAIVAADVRLSPGTGDWASQPDILWNGSELAIAWHDDRDGGDYEVYFARYQPDGTRIGSDMRVTNSPSAYSWYPAIAWSGSNYGVFFRDRRLGNHDAYFARLDSTGTKIGTESRISVDSGWAHDPDIVWAGSNWGLSWEDDRNSWQWEVYFARLQPDGTMIGSEVRITNDPASSEIPFLAWSGSNYAVTWLDNRLGEFHTYVATISDAGVKTSSNIRITLPGADPYAPSIAWSGSGYGMSWFDQRTVLPGMYMDSVTYCD
jgi:hypothetical protein